MSDSSSNRRGFGALVFLLLASGAACASKNDSGGGGTGGTSQSGGAPGTGGLSQSGGAPGTGGGSAGDGGVDYQAMLTAAMATWAAAKPGCPAYRYQTQHSTQGFSYCGTTTIQIVNDQPVERSFVSDESGCPYPPDAGVTNITEQWDEVGAQVGSHTDGDSPLTVEQLFAYCQTILAADPSMYRVELAVNSEGVPVGCTSTLLHCVDSCTGGIDIPTFTCEQPPAG
jgi:hypothetical protein